MPIILLLLVFHSMLLRLEIVGLLLLLLLLLLLETLDRRTCLRVGEWQSGDGEENLAGCDEDVLRHLIEHRDGVGVDQHEVSELQLLKHTSQRLSMNHVTSTTLLNHCAHWHHSGIIIIIIIIIITIISTAVGFITRQPIQGRINNSI